MVCDLTNTESMYNLTSDCVVGLVAFGPNVIAK